MNEKCHLPVWKYENILLSFDMFRKAYFMHGNRLTNTANVRSVLRASFNNTVIFYAFYF